MEKWRRLSRSRLTWLQYGAVALLAISLWTRRSPHPYYEPETTRFSELRRTIPQTGAPDISVTITAPRRFRVNDEHPLTTEVEITGLPRGESAVVTIEVTAPSLQISPASLRLETGGFTGGTFVVSSTTPGFKRLHVNVTTKASTQLPTIDIDDIALEVYPYEQRDLIARLVSIAQALGLPALVVLLVTEILRRHRAPPSPPPPDSPRPSEAQQRESGGGSV